LAYLFSQSCGPPVVRGADFGNHWDIDSSYVLSEDFKQFFVACKVRLVSVKAVGI